MLKLGCYSVIALGTLRAMASQKAGKGRSSSLLDAPAALTPASAAALKRACLVDWSCDRRSAIVSSRFMLETANYL